MSEPDGGVSGVMGTDLALPVRRGKVRDVYELRPGGDGAEGEPRVLIVATDRISAFDVVMPTPIPGKGVLLTRIAGFWLRWIERLGLARTHLLSLEAADVPEAALGNTPRDVLEGRVTIGRACRVVPVECVVRGYLEGSGWRDYERTGAVSGVRLPAGLRRCERLGEPIFTPATKATEGHDENIDEASAREAVDAAFGAGTMDRLRDVSLAIYREASAYALERGIIIADTKFEFGVPIGADGEPIAGEAPILVDEALTPDSSRFWPADEYEPGRTQRSYDKQYVREYLESLVEAGSWDKSAPGPELPAGVVRGTLDRYGEAARALTDA